MGWLVLGGILGAFFISGVTSTDYRSDEAVIIEPPPGYWQALFVPLLTIGLAIAFETSPGDLYWSIVAQGLTYTVVVAFSYIPSDSPYARDVGIAVSSVYMTIVANAWSRWKNKPTNVLLVPCLVLQVSGSIGFRGIISLVEGETALGTQQFLRMFYVALLTFVGVAVGMVVLKPRSTI